MKLYDYFRLLREQSELSQVDFAKKIGVSKSYLCDLEMDRRTISVKKAIIVAKKLHLTPIEFIQMIVQDSLYREGLTYTVELFDNRQLGREHGTGIPSMAEDTEVAE